MARYAGPLLAPVDGFDQAFLPVLTISSHVIFTGVNLIVVNLVHLTKIQIIKCKPQKNPKSQEKGNHNKKKELQKNL